MEVSGERSLLVIAGRVHTFAGDEPLPGPVGVLCREGRITAVGPLESVRDRARSVPELDLRDATLTPGLTDAHIHLTEWALARRDVDLSMADSPEAAARMVADHDNGPTGEWVRGRGWNPHRWGGAHPDRRWLDTLMPERPVLLQSHDMHALWVNGETLRRAAIGKDTPDPAGGRIVRDDLGRPTGLLLENAAQLVARMLPPLGIDETAAAVVDAQRALHAWGITAVHSLPAIHIAEPEPLGVLEALRDSGRLRLRVLQHLALDQLDRAIDIGLVSGFGGNRIRVGGVKMFLDGALGSRTAWMREPYEGTDATGIQVLDAAEFRHHVGRAARAGLASVVHAIGDAAVDLAFEVLGEPGSRAPGLPHRIEHVQCCPAARIAWAGNSGITCSVQPAHLMTDWRIADRHWGRRRSARTYAFRSLLDGGARLAFGSDAPVESADPRQGLFAAVTRTDLDHEPAGGWFPDERLTMAQAFAAYTRRAAEAAGRADGAIQIGAPADFAAWASDPLTAAGEEILDLECIATIVDGELVHSTRPL